MEENIVRWLFCGASAGLAVDLSLYPLDTIKTRLQSAQGFSAAGGFKNIYRGMSSVAIGSAPGAALFFSTYTTSKHLLGNQSTLTHALAACVAEVVACAVRVPTELIKQRAQATHGRRITTICRSIFSAEGINGFYRGYMSTLSREIPFSLIEFPLWEALKVWNARRRQRDCSPLESAACGSIAGSIAAAITTPLDVAKTRIMLNEGRLRPRILSTLQSVAHTGGMKRLYSGVVPRTVWMGLGGFVFFGAFEVSLKFSYWVFPESRRLALN
ncbi:S-adenosylmethionine mitochondrial carrier protein [Toxocara canis]|uniref:S-adenosylmethionine mitochondrial carrier protein n=1 Tax=Toxocara canis TaxID=6265 RepID=A0A0B2URG7_TOXCA|nr:S-adenosylmethionine mitochondrial carrier protein [Toxocara canis]